MSRMKLLTAAVAAAAIASIVGGPVVSGDHGNRGRRRLKAELSSFNEVPQTLSTPASGSFRGELNKDETEITYRLDFANLTGTVTQAHIHLGDRHVAGGVSVWLCGTMTNPGPAGTPVCGPGGEDEAEAEGTLTAANVVGPAGQGIAANEFAELVKAIRAGVTYVNVHSSTFGPGEIRGQIKAED